MSELFSKSVFKPMLPDDYFRFIAIWFVRPLTGVSFVRPEHVVVLGFICKILAAIFLLEQNGSLAAVFLFVSIILDNIDGMLARATGRVSEFGGLLDLASDFIGTILLFAVIGEVTGEVLLSVIGFFSYIIVMEIWSWLRRVEVGLKEGSVVSAEEYLNSPMIEKAEGFFEKAANKIYMLTWHKFFGVALMVFPEKRKLKNGFVIYILSFGALGINQFILCGFLAFGEVTDYLIYNILLLPVYVFLVRWFSIRY